MRAKHLMRLAAATALAFIGLSVAILVGVGAAGPSAVSPAITSGRCFTARSASAHISGISR
jgi:hypothetical protein